MPLDQVGSAAADRIYPGSGLQSKLVSLLSSTEARTHEPSWYYVVDPSPSAARPLQLLLGTFPTNHKFENQAVDFHRKESW